MGLIDVSVGKIELKDEEVIIKQEECIGGRVYLTNQRLVRFFDVALLGAPKQMEAPLNEITKVGKIRGRKELTPSRVAAEYHHLGKTGYVGFKPTTSSADDWVLQIRRMANLPVDSDLLLHIERKDVKYPGSLQIILLAVIIVILIVVLGWLIASGIYKPT